MSSGFNNQFERDPAAIYTWEKSYKRGKRHKVALALAGFFVALVVAFCIFAFR